MKTLLIALLAALVAIPTLNAADLSKEDRTKALQYLQKPRADVVPATKGLSDAQWNFKPGPDRWSVAEVTEHIAAAEDFIRGMVQEQTMKAPALPGRDLKKT